MADVSSRYSLLFLLFRLQREVDCVRARFDLCGQGGLGVVFGGEDFGAGFAVVAAAGFVGEGFDGGGDEDPVRADQGAVIAGGVDQGVVPFAVGFSQGRASLFRLEGDFRIGQGFVVQSHYAGNGAQRRGVAASAAG